MIWPFIHRKQVSVGHMAFWAVITESIGTKSLFLLIYSRHNLGHSHPTNETGTMGVE
jgi:hypothetical protein